MKTKTAKQDHMHSSSYWKNDMAFGGTIYDEARIELRKLRIQHEEEPTL